MNSVLIVEIYTEGEKMNAESFTRIAKFTILGLMIFMTACSPLVAPPTSGVPSLTVLPMIQSSPTLEPTAVPTNPLAIPSSLPGADCSDSAQYISDDGMDGTTYAANTPFTKTWRLKNTGSCTWDSSYLVYYISGITMSQQPGYWIVQQGQMVAPGETVDISVAMTSPVESGSYQSYWGLKKENGQLMPIQGGAKGNSFYVKIKVGNGAASGNITTASIAIELEQGSGSVCTAYSTYFVHAYITADGPTTATYEINSTAGQIAAGNFQNWVTNELSPVETGTLVFDQADTKTLSWRFLGPYPYPDNISVNLRVNGGEWHTSRLAGQE
jgi:Ig-like domain from next to BRCA1 gene